MDWWSRIYSVLLIAILFTLIIDYGGSFLSLDYLNPKYLPQDQPGLNHFVCYLNVFVLDAFWNDFILASNLGVLLMFEFTWPENSFFQRLNTHMAEFSYSLYSFHLSIIVFYYAVLVKLYGFSSNQWQAGVLMAAVCVMVSKAFYFVTEAKRWEYRSWAASIIYKLRVSFIWEKK